MIITQIEQIKSISIQPAPARVTKVFHSEKGDLFLEYEFDFMIDTSKVFLNGLSYIEVEAYDVLPRGALDRNLLFKRDVNFNSAGTEMLMGIGTDREVNKSNMQSLPDSNKINREIEQHGRKRRIDNQNLIGFGKNIQNTTIRKLGRKNIKVKNAILNFSLALATGPVRKKDIKPIATYGISIDGTIDSKFRELVKSNIAGLTAAKSQQKKRPRRGKKHAVSNSMAVNVKTHYILDTFDLVLIPASSRTTSREKDLPSLTTVINYRENTHANIESSPTHLTYQRAGVNDVRPTTPNDPGRFISSQTRMKPAYTARVEGPDAQSGKTIFTRDTRRAAFRAIYEYGIPPTALVSVSCASTIVSPMQNYQGTSKIRSNGY